LHLAAAGDNTAGEQHGGVGVEEARPAAVCNDLVGMYLQQKHATTEHATRQRR
jgi:hypothetical protein